jgi:CubicO group peptidase (beta-lactamase class C family)
MPRTCRPPSLHALLALTVIALLPSQSIGEQASAIAHQQPQGGAAAVASPEIAAALAPIIKAHEIPGMVAAIVEGDGTIEIGCAGIRANGAPQPIAITDQMHLGSCTKSMTATLLATLVQDRRLSFEATIGEVFGDLEGRMNPAWKDVSLRLLLSNRSGAPGDLTKDGLWRDLWTHAGTPTSARMLLVESVLTRPPEATPGSKYIYSNAGFAIAGAMAEQVTGDSWEDLMMERVFEPLGMKSAGFGAPGSAAAVDQPRGHKADGTPVPPGRNADNPVAIGPAGLVHCSLIDWSKYIALHLRGAQGRDTAILKAEAFRTLHAAAKKHEGEQSPDYAMGWSVTRRPWAGDGDDRGGAGGGDKVLTHNGTNTMWFAVAWLAPEKDFAVLVACNKGGAEAEKACDEAASAMIERYQQRLSWP